jgi:hypothetical protein
MSSASTKRISTDSAPADPLDTLLGRFDVMVTAIETLAGELKAVAQRLLREAESKSIQSTVASVDLLDSSAWVKELEASAAFSAREAGICAGACWDATRDAHSEARPSVEARGSTRLVSTDPVQRMAALVEAAEKKDWEKVKVRRLLETVSSTASGPLRAVCLGLGQWTLDAVVARPIRPCGAKSSPYVRRQSGNFDAACRRTSVPVRTSSSVARTLPGRLARSRDFSPPPSPAIAVSATF